MRMFANDNRLVHACTAVALVAGLQMLGSAPSLAQTAFRCGPAGAVAPLPKMRPPALEGAGTSGVVSNQAASKPVCPQELVPLADDPPTGRPQPKAIRCCSRARLPRPAECRGAKAHPER